MTAVLSADARSGITVAPDDQANRDLVAAVHPVDWVNPTAPEGKYNLVVIGAGTAGLVTAAGAAGLGAKVALIEEHLMGGDCLNVGCVPSKAIIAGARAAAAARGASDYGTTSGQVETDFAAVMARMRYLRAKIAPVDGAARFRDLGVDVYLGRGRFVSGSEVEVEGQRLRFARAVIATGARAAVPPIAGLEEAGYLVNETVFELTELPRRLVVIGGGAIGCELAQSFARFGSEVTIIDLAPRILGVDDRDAAAVVARALVRDGIKLVLDAGVRRVESDRTVVVDVDDAERRFAADQIVVAAGRRPNVDDLGLEAVGVETDRGGVVVSDRLRTSNRRIFAAGDCCSRYKFTHAADAMARIVLRNSLFFGRSRASELVIPWATYTDPELAHVGLTPESAVAGGIAIDTFEMSTDEIDRGIVDGDTGGFIRIHTRAGSDTIVGATVVSRHGGELISELALAMTRGIGLGAVSGAIHPYPTMSLGIKQVADQYNRTRLKPWVARLFRRLLAWRRR